MNTSRDGLLVTLPGGQTHVPTVWILGSHLDVDTQICLPVPSCPGCSSGATEKKSSPLPDILRCLQARHIPAPGDLDTQAGSHGPSSFLVISCHAPHMSGPDLLDMLWFANILLRLLSPGMGRSLQCDPVAPDLQLHL